MSGECQTLRTDKDMPPIKKPYDRLISNLQFRTMYVTTEIVGGSGPYKVSIEYETPRGGRATAEISGDNSVLADISPRIGFKPWMKLENNSDHHIRVEVCIDYNR